MPNNEKIYNKAEHEANNVAHALRQTNTLAVQVTQVNGIISRDEALKSVRA